MPVNETRNERIHIWVTGRVQGVGFRAYVVDQARRLGLSGWVRNVGWNEVETVAEGKRRQLEIFLDLVHAGPQGSRVEETRSEWEEAGDEFTRFEINYGH